MLIGSRELKAVSRAASRERGRYAIDGIHLSRNRIAATDGRMLLEAPIDEMDTDEHVTPRVMSMDTVKAILADPMTKHLKAAVIRSNGELTYQGAGGNIPAKPMDEQFPDTDGLIPGDDKIGFRVSFDASRLAALCAAALDTSKDRPCLALEFTKDVNGAPCATGAVRVTIAGSKVRGVIMPMSL